MDKHLKMAFCYWCEWNIKKIPESDFVSKYGMTPMQFERAYWKNGLQDFWIKKIYIIIFKRSLIQHAQGGKGGCMKLEDQVCSLESAKKLKELGVKQESYFYWYHCPYNDEISLDVSDTKSKAVQRICSAFTIAELGEMLPNWWTSYRVNKGNAMAEKTGCFWVCESGQNDHKERGITEAEARAKMLIYLIESNTLKIGEEM